MNRNKHDKHIRRLHAGAAFLLLPLINLRALFYTDIFVNNQSYIGNELHHPLYLILWGVISALSFWSLTKRCLQLYPCMPESCERLLAILCAAMILSVLLPYDPQASLIISQWHVRLAMFGSGGYALLFFCFLLNGLACGFQALRPYLFAYLLLCFVSLYSFATHGGVTSFTEITYSIGMGILLYHLCYHSPR